MTADQDNAAAHRRLTGLLCGVVSGVCYGVMAFLVHIAGGRIPASEIVFVRASCAVILILPLAARHRKQWLSRSSVLLWIRSSIGALSVSCFAWNLQHTTVGFANTLFNLAPIAMVIFAAIARQETIEIGRLADIVVVVAASALFWHGSRLEAGPLVWAIGLVGMCAAAAAYALLKSLPPLWDTYDITWASSLATLPVALIFRHEPWITPTGSAILTLIAICILSLAGSALATISFRYIELSTATALIPSAIIWGVLLDMCQHNHPAVQAIIGCILYLIAVVRLTISRPTPITVPVDSPFSVLADG
jgi:drug/metabolite transporter (DMT)-like permease